MKINDASRATGVSRDMIRFYEKQGLVCPARLPNGYRDYSDKDLYLLTVIRYLSNLGVPLRVISTAFESGQTDLLVGNLKDEISRLTLLRSQIEVRIAAAKESIACFNLLSSGTPWEVYEAPARYLFSFGSLRYPVYRSGPEPGDSFAFYYRQRYGVDGSHPFLRKQAAPGRPGAGSAPAARGFPDRQRGVHRAHAPVLPEERGSGVSER